MKTCCLKHPKYTGLRHRPRSACIDCWQMWLEHHPDEPITGKEMLKIMLAIKVNALKVVGRHTRCNHLGLVSD